MSCESKSSCRMILNSILIAEKNKSADETKYR